MKNQNAKKIIFLILILTLLGLICFFGYKKSLTGYTTKTILPTSSLSSALSNFSYNESQHEDDVFGCWYDSGDYVIFLQRNTEALFYLSRAYEYSDDIEIKKDLLDTITQQLSCVETMIEKNIKQFRDQDNHGFHIPPVWNRQLFPNKTYYLADDEGKDVYLMLALIYKNLDDVKKFDYYKNVSADKTNATISANCCEAGPLVLSSDELSALEYLTRPQGVYQPTNTWGIQFEALATLTSGNIGAIKGVLSYIDEHFDETGKPFHYLGGNYDIAGTVALERLYEKQTGDTSFSSLSDSLWDYLHGENTYNIDFTNSNYIYHPCYFFHTCTLSDTLINGVSKDGFMNMKSWETSEVQIVGQAQYILAEVLYR